MLYEIVTYINGTVLFALDTDSFLTALVTAVYERINLNDADLRARNLSGAKLHGAYLRDANLSYANCTGTDFREADLTGANLSYANFTGANLQYCLLTGAKMQGATFSSPMVPGKEPGSGFFDADIPPSDDTPMTIAEIQAVLAAATPPAAILTATQLAVLAGYLYPPNTVTVDVMANILSVAGCALYQPQLNALNDTDGPNL